MRARELARLTLVLSVSALNFFVRVLLYFTFEDASALRLVKACDLEDLGRVEPGVCFAAHDCDAVAGHLVDGHARVARLVDGRGGCRHGERDCWRGGGARFPSSGSGTGWGCASRGHSVWPGLCVSRFSPAAATVCVSASRGSGDERSATRRAAKLAQFPRSSPSVRGCAVSLYSTFQQCKMGLE